MDSRLHEAEIPLPGAATQLIRYFKDTEIRESMETALSRIAPDKCGVILRGRIDKDGGAAVLACRLKLLVCWPHR